MSTMLELVFPAYTLERTLKISKRGNVSVVRHQDTKIRYIFREFEGSGEAYRKLQQVNSPHLPKIHEVKEQDNRVFVLEEYVSGDTLAFLLEQNPLTLNYTKEIAVQICDALAILHEHSMVHRDIKPENIIIRGNNAVLIDFDTSRVVKPENYADTQIMGTTGYAAPEQYGFSQTDARADIYTMGILINEMLTRQHPSKLLAEGPLRPVIERCIEVNVDKRYFSVSDLRSAILTCQKSQKGKIWSALIAVAAVMLCAAGLIYGTSPKEAAPAETTPQLLEEPSEEAETPNNMEAFQRQPIEVSSEAWPHSMATYATPFQYDLDGDGETESYQFGICHKNVPVGFQWTLTDYFQISEGDVAQRRAYPAVWKILEDGSLELAEDFAPLLSDAQIRVWRSSETDAPLPEVYASEDLWTGGVDMVLTYDNIGVWLYEIHGTLDGQQLTALAMTTLDKFQ